MTDAGLAKGNKICGLQEDDSSGRNGQLRLYKHAEFALIYSACANATLNTLPIRAAEMNVAVYWKTFMKPFVTHSLCSGGHRAPENEPGTTGNRAPAEMESDLAPPSGAKGAANGRL